MQVEKDHLSTFRALLIEAEDWLCHYEDWKDIGVRRRNQFLDKIQAALDEEVWDNKEVPEEK